MNPSVKTSDSEIVADEDDIGEMISNESHEFQKSANKRFNSLIERVRAFEIWYYIELRNQRFLSQIDLGFQ